MGLKVGRGILAVIIGCFMLALMAPVSEAACVLQSAGELTAQLTWTNSDTVTTDSVNILRSNSAGAETVLINVPFGVAYTDTIQPVNVASITYFYEVQAKGLGGVSPASNEVCKTFFQGPPSPSGLSVK